MLGWADRIEKKIKNSKGSGDYQFMGSCISLKGECINQMNKERVDVTLRTIRKHCDTKPFEDALGYVRNGEGLRLCKDWHVGFYKSRYMGKPVYYIEHSRIEYVWAKG